MLVRLASLAVSNAFTLLRLLPMGGREKDIEILGLRHQLSVLQRQLGADRPRFEPADRALVAALLTPLPRDTLRRLRPLVRPDTAPRWHRDLIKRRHTERRRRKHPGRPPALASIRRLVLRRAHENPWGYRRVHGELATHGIKVAAPAVREILRQAGIDPAPDRNATTWSAFLRSQAEATWPATSLKPSHPAASTSTSWPSSSTPPGTCASPAPPRIPQPHGPPRPRRTW